MRNVYPADELAHLWAHKSQASGRNSTHSVYFQDETIYSYGSHFPMARHVTNKRNESAVLYYSATRSITTSKHQSYVRRAISHLTVFTVPSVRERIDHKENIKHYQDTITWNLESAARARSNGEYRLNNATKLAEELKAYGKFFGVKVPKITLPELGNLDDLKKKLAERAAKEAARTRRENAKAIKEWREGIRQYVNAPDTMLRIVGDEVQTSRGARFPVAHACRGLKLVEACVAAGREWVTNGHTCHLGVYRIDRIEANGTVHAGCHVVTYPEISRIAPQLREILLATSQREGSW